MKKISVQLIEICLMVVIVYALPDTKEGAVTCGGSIEANNTLFQNPDFPSATYEGGFCEVTVLSSLDEDICQIKLELNTFSLAPPDPSSGICLEDYMTILEAEAKVPNICGYNDGQHIYIDVDPSGSNLLKIAMDGNPTEIYQRIFDINVVKIPCDSPSRAPSGCLQYFPTVLGTVQSFNFPEDPRDSFDNQITSQLSNTEYTICIRPERGFCSITWTPDPTEEPYNFFVTGYGEADSLSVIGDPSAAEWGDNRCREDYVLIPGGVFQNYSGVETGADRFCSVAFPTYVTTSYLPFQMFVKTDGVEDVTQSSNFGFSLTFRQNVCT